MKIYKRKEPHFALCGLNCCLCPRFHTNGSSKCPGCGGNEFYDKHPTCAVITCSKKHGNIEYCFECNDFPCERYKRIGKADSFITYKNIIKNFESAKINFEDYMDNLKKKYKYLKLLLEKYNDGKSKALYCTAVELIPLEYIEEILNIAMNETDNKNTKERAIKVSEKIKEKAKALNIELVLRK